MSDDSRRAFLLAFAAFSLYLAFLSKAYVFEGLIRAMPIETVRWVHLFAGNYLLYGPLGLTFHTLLQTLGIQQMAVTSLQVMDALLGAGGLFIFYQLLRRLDGDIFSSISWTCVLGVSLGYWLWSTDAENYILSTFLLITQMYYLVCLARGESVDPLFLGALQGVAILGHIVNILFALVGGWCLLRVYGPQWKKPLTHYAAGAATVAVTAYALVLIFIQKPASLQAAWGWFKGSAGTNPGSINLGGSFQVHKFWEWLKMSAHIFGSFRPDYAHPPAWPMSSIFLSLSWILLAVFVGILLYKIRDLAREERVVAGACLIWLGAYALVFTRWEPWTMVYRVSDLVPLCILLFLAHRAFGLRHAAWQAVPAALAFCLAIGNGAAEIRPRSYASNNPQLTRMEFIKAHTREGDWVAGDSAKGEIYIPYFAARRPLVIERFARDPERLAAGINELLAKGQTVYVPSNVLESERWKRFFSRYRPLRKAKDKDGFTLYRLRRYHS
jgi:hypothetical protein